MTGAAAGWQAVRVAQDGLEHFDQGFNVSRYAVALAMLLMATSCYTSAAAVGEDEAFVSNGLKVSEDKYTRLRTYTGPEYLSKEETFGSIANWVKMSKIESLDRSKQNLYVVIRTYYGSDTIYAPFTQAFDDLGTQLIAQPGKLERKQIITFVELTAEDVNRIIGRNEDTSIKLLGSDGEVIFLLPRSYVVDFVAATR